MINMVKRVFSREEEGLKEVIYLHRCLVEQLLEREDHKRENQSSIV
jgi:hypothetical protein